MSVEAVWTPDTRTSTLPKRGAEWEFASIPFRFGNPVVRLPDDADEFSLSRSEGGVRVSALVSGWDASLIYYDQGDKSSVLYHRLAHHHARRRRLRGARHTLYGQFDDNDHVTLTTTLRF